MKDEKKRFKATTWAISSGEKETESNSSKGERQAHLVVMAKTNSSSNSKDSESNDEVSSRYDELFDKYEEMLEEFEKLTDKNKLLKKTFQPEER